MTAPGSRRAPTASWPAGSAPTRANAPYRNPFGNGALCQNASGATPQYSNGVSGSCPPQITNPPARGCPDGYSAFQIDGGFGGVWNYPITVWRNNNYVPQFDTGYQYKLSPSSAGSQVLDAGTTSPIQLWNGSANLPTSMFTLSAAGSGWKISPISNASMCLDAGNGAPNDNVNLGFCNGSAGQTFTVTPDAQSGDFYVKVSNTGRCMQIRNNGTWPGSAVEVADCAGAAGQKFDISASTFVPDDGADYNFENGTQGWSFYGSPGIGVTATDVVSYAGAQSLAVGMNGPAGAVFVSSTNLVPPPGATVTYHFYLPPSSPITSVQPYVQQGAGGNYAWTGNYQPTSSLRAGAWNTLTVQVPFNAQIWRVGIVFGTGWGGAATAYVDSVNW